MAININIQPTNEDLTGKSHWWGFPDLPDNMEWPCLEEDYLLTFVCQIRLEDIAHLDPEGALPHKGILWFFANLDYFLGEDDAPCSGMGEWEEGHFKVIYSEECSKLNTHRYYWEDGSPAVMPAERIVFEECDSEAFGFKLLGLPAMTEGYENENEGMVSLLQLDEEERWHLRFFDCGTINFMIPVESLKELDFSKTSLYLHSS